MVADFILGHGDGMSNFDWYSDEDRRWEPEPPKQPRKERPFRRWPFFLLVVLALSALGTFLLYRRADERISAAETAVKADVLAAHELMMKAGTAGDVDLFRAGLSGRQPDWTAAQTTLIEENQLWDRTPFGLTLLDITSENPPEVDIALDLRTAEVGYRIPYQVGGERVELRYTAVYRRGENRWLLAPPEADFWGTWVTNQGAVLTLTYPQRDASIGERLGFDIDRMLRKMCATSPGLDCPTDLNVSVRFTTNPDSLVNVFDAANALQSSVQINLPTPTLLGIPMNDAGYEALYKGYAAQIALAVMVDVTEYNCCQGGLYFRAMADWQLSQLGVLDWPLTADQFETLLLDDAWLRLPFPGWRSSDLTYQKDPDWIWVYALVQFIAEDGDLDLPLLQRTLAEGFQVWLQAAGIDPQAHSAKWISFLYTQSTSGKQTGAAKLEPESDLNVVCTQNEATQSLYRYDFADDAWQPLLMAPNEGDVFFIYPTDYPQSFFVIEASIVDPEAENETFLSESYLWQEDGRIPIYNSSEKFAGDEVVTSVAYPMGMDPQRRFMYVFIWTEGRDDAPENLQLRVIDLPTCTTEGCEYSELDFTPEELAWLPVWSPMGEYILLGEQSTYYVGAMNQAPTAPIYLADILGQERVLVGEGRDPFWLDSRSYGFLRASEEGGYEAVTAVIGDNTLRVLLNSSDLNTALPPELVSETPPLRLSYLLSNTAVAGEFMVVAAEPGGRANIEYYFLLRNAGFTGQSLTFVDRLPTGGMAAFSPNGRYLHLIPNHWAGDSSPKDSVLMNLQTGEKQSLPLTSDYYFAEDGWSHDSQWLIQAYSNFVLLYAPERGIRRLVQVDMPECEQPFWSAR